MNERDEAALRRSGGRGWKRGRRRSRRKGRKGRKGHSLPPVERANALGTELVVEGGELLGETVLVTDPDDEQGPKVRVYRGASPLRRLYHKRAIEFSQYDAGMRFNQRYLAARLGPHYSLSDASRVFVDVSVFKGDENLAAFNDAAVECLRVLSIVGVISGSMLVHVVGQERSLEEWVQMYARPNPWGATVDPTSAGWVLRTTLGTLAGLYEMLDKRGVL